MDMPLHLSGPALGSKSSHRTTMVCTIKISSLSFDTCEAKNRCFKMLQGKVVNQSHWNGSGIERAEIASQKAIL